MPCQRDLRLRIDQPDPAHNAARIHKEGKRHYMHAKTIIKRRLDRHDRHLKVQLLNGCPAIFRAILGNDQYLQFPRAPRQIVHATDHLRKRLQRAIDEDEHLPVISGRRHSQTPIDIRQAPGWNSFARRKTVSGNPDGAAQTQEPGPQDHEDSEGNKDKFDDHEKRTEGYTHILLLASIISPLPHAMLSATAPSQRHREASTISTA